MFQSKFFESMNRSQIAEQIRKEGFDPIYVQDPPGRVYRTHNHPETKLLAFLEGSMEVTVAGQKFYCRPGDKLIIDGNIEHSALAGPEGCGFFWSEKL